MVLFFLEGGKFNIKSLGSMKRDIKIIKGLLEAIENGDRVKDIEVTVTLLDELVKKVQKLQYDYFCNMNRKLSGRGNKK